MPGDPPPPDAVGDPLDPYGWGPRVAGLVADADVDDPPGRVVRVDYDRVTVVTADGLVTARAGVLPAAGDWVLVAPPDAEGGDRRISATLPRWSALERMANDGEIQTMAADLDVVAVVAGLDRGPNWNRLDRELVLAWGSGARPVVVLNKADLRDDVDAVLAAAADRLVGVSVLASSTVTGQGIDELRALARPDRTIALLGASGVGKSSLVNALVGEDVLDVGDVRTDDRRGRHTTTARYLVPLPGGGVLLDTPGVRSLGLGDAEEGLASAFGDVEELATRCRFRDCAHESEPGCAVRAAVASGELAAARFASWQKLRDELAWLEERQDPAEQAERRRRDRAVMRAYRKVPKR